MDGCTIEGRDARGSVQMSSLRREDRTYHEHALRHACITCGVSTESADISRNPANHAEILRNPQKSRHFPTKPPEPLPVARARTAPTGRPRYPREENIPQRG